MGDASSSLLPLWEKVARKARRMRGLYPRRQTPHPSAMLRIASTLSHKGRGKAGRDNEYAVIFGMVRRTRPQMRNCASGNLEIPGSMLRIAPE